MLAQPHSPRQVGRLVHAGDSSAGPGLDRICPTPPVRMSRNERFIMPNAIIKQLELGFNGVKLCPGGARPEGRIVRAAWWFAQMRDVVERAMDWNDVASPPPEQIWIPGAIREVKV